MVNVFSVVWWARSAAVCTRCNVRVVCRPWTAPVSPRCRPSSDRRRLQRHHYHSHAVRPGLYAQVSCWQPEVILSMGILQFQREFMKVEDLCYIIPVTRTSERFWLAVVDWVSALGQSIFDSGWLYVAHHKGKDRLGFKSLCFKTDWQRPTYVFKTKTWKHYAEMKNIVLLSILKHSIRWYIEYRKENRNCEHDSLSAVTENITRFHCIADMLTLVSHLYHVISNIPIDMV